MKRPDGMPDIHPTTFTFTQDGAPLADAKVTLISTDGTNVQWPAGGTTDSSGVVKVKTMSQFDGVPAGKFKVTVSKTETEGTNTAVEDSDDPGAKRAVSEVKTYYLVESKFRSVASSPLDVEIKPGKNIETFDVGKAVRELAPVARD